MLTSCEGSYVCTLNKRCVISLRKVFHAETGSSWLVCDKHCVLFIYRYKTFPARKGYTECVPRHLLCSFLEDCVVERVQRGVAVSGWSSTGPGPSGLPVHCFLPGCGRVSPQHRIWSPGRCAAPVVRHGSSVSVCCAWPHVRLCNRRSCATHEHVRLVMSGRLGLLCFVGVRRRTWCANVLWFKEMEIQQVAMVKCGIGELTKLRITTILLLSKSARRHPMCWLVNWCEVEFVVFVFEFIHYLPLTVLYRFESGLSIRSSNPFLRDGEKNITTFSFPI